MKKSLFNKNGKLRWSYKFSECKECGLIDYPHKANGLCTHCYERVRSAKNKRVIFLKINSAKRAYQQKVIKALENKEEWRKMRGPKKTGFDKKKYKKQWYKKVREKILLLRRGQNLKDSGGKVLEIIIKHKSIYIPYIELDKKECEYEQWKENKRIFKLVTK